MSSTSRKQEATSQQESSSPTASTVSSLPTKQKRVLACVLCQQRKIKCDRHFPCSNCTRAKTECVPAGLVQRPRKRRFAERQLLDQLRKYEDIMHRNGIEFESLHKNAPNESEVQDTAHSNDGSDEEDSERVPDARDFWNSVRDWFRYADSRPSESPYESASSRCVPKDRATKDLWTFNGRLLFEPNLGLDMASIRPEPVHVFKLWQVYLDNVDPLLKVTHTPTLQPRIIEAISDPKNIPAALEALMFGIYCMAVRSLGEEECQQALGSSRSQLLQRFQIGCQQALVSCEFLRSNDRDCLTALYLYLSMLAVAICVAKRIGLHNEAELSRCTVLEAEIRRRLWWSLSIFETRISEMAEHKILGLSRDWDCKMPLNVNDSDLRPEVKQPPKVELKTSEALYAVVRCELADFYRRNRINTNFSLSDKKDNKGFAKDFQTSLSSLEKMIEEKYLKLCDPENPLHFITMWTARTMILRGRLMETYVKSAMGGGAHISEAQRDASIGYTFTILEIDTKMMTSPLIKGFHWMLHIYFPLPAYIHLLLELKKRPTSHFAEKAWQLMGAHHEARFAAVGQPTESPMYKFFAGIILKAWEAMEIANAEREALQVPKIVDHLRGILSQLSLQGDSGQDSSYQVPDGQSVNPADLSMPMPLGFDPDSLAYSMAWQTDFAGSDPGMGMPLGSAPPTTAPQFSWSGGSWAWTQRDSGGFNFQTPL